MTPEFPETDDFVPKWDATMKKKPSMPLGCLLLILIPLLQVIAMLITIAIIT